MFSFLFSLIWLSHFNCSGDEDHIFSCAHDNVGFKNCSDLHVAGVNCAEKASPMPGTIFKKAG